MLKANHPSHYLRIPYSIPRPDGPYLLERLHDTPVPMESTQGTYSGLVSLARFLCHGYSSNVNSSAYFSPLLEAIAVNIPPTP